MVMGAYRIVCFFHFKGEDCYPTVKKAAKECIGGLNYPGLAFAGVDDRLGGALQDLKPGESEVMVGWDVEAPNISEAEKVADKLYTMLKEKLGEKFVELRNPKDRVNVYPHQE